MRGGAIYLRDICNATFKGKSRVSFINNTAKEYGGALFFINNCNIKFKEHTHMQFYNSSSYDGGALYGWNKCNVTIEENCIAVFNNNEAVRDGGVLNMNIYSDITFQGNSTIEFNGNRANHHGGSIYLRNKCNVFFNEENPFVIFYNNSAGVNGGALYALDNSDITVKGNSTTICNDNKASGDGGALYINVNSAIKFKGNSKANFNDNIATHFGGALCSKSNITFEHNCTIIFHHNEATQGGAIFAVSDTLFKHNSKVKFSSNKASTLGGALHVSNLTFNGNAVVTFNNNEALLNGGAFYAHNSSITMRHKSVVIFINNSAENGGAAFISASTLLLTEYTNATFAKNMAWQDGGVIYFSGYINAWDNSKIIIRGSSTTIFNNNKASDDGGALYINANSAITFQENTVVKLNGNKATYFGGALFSKSNITFKHNCTITFHYNEATQGGAIFTVSDTVFTDNSTVQFDNNKANTLGGALHASNLTFNGNTVVTFSNNEAELNGGAVFIFASTLFLTEHTNVTFINNTAGQDGGAIYFNAYTNAMIKNYSTITLISNTADNHGGAVYAKITQGTKFFNLSVTKFGNNTAGLAGNFLYIDVTRSCNDSCFTDKIAEIDPLDKEINTSPNKIELHYPAKCISNDTIECEKYYINNIMLGQEITINPCLLDYYNKPAEATQFKIIGQSHENYLIHGSEYASVSCNHTIEGISILGNKPISSLPLNYSMSLTSYATSKCVSTNLIVELSSCHAGFQYQSESKKCECYDTSDIVHCSGSSSTIKRGYWFGSVTGIPTVTFCPINYCNFTCCKTTNGYYELSPVRVNQCKSHRSGTACGSCEEGYTLSFDSAECIAVNKCTTGQTTLIVTLTVFYWFIVIVAVFIIMYYQVGIGYFYVVTYYYSVVDILLSQHTDLSNSLYIMVTIMSSIAKVTPQFLGHLCLLENMSGIDQQFIHYVHPLAVSVILIMISWLARNSKRLTAFISKGVIRVICFLLLLSYTSVATTSLLLMRSLTFADVDNVYTYLSPDIQYFHGRHLAYGIIAIIFTLLIVIGLPLLLLLEPFLNGKINFIKIKPLLDQFQGCYKDNYCWFAAYYMICRLVIISIIIANLSDTFISRYLLITATTISALIHLLVRPYMDNILNMSDGAILQLMVLVTVLPLFEYFDTYESSLVMVIVFALVIIPLMQFVAVKVFTSKQTLKVIMKKVIEHFSFPNKVVHEDEQANVVANKALTSFIGLNIDDNMRRNAIVCEM